LTPSARSANLIAGDGTKNGLPAPNNELTANPQQPLDRKSPIQVCELSVPPVWEWAGLFDQSLLPGPVYDVRMTTKQPLLERG
jgi:hypothetical protein